LARKVKVTLSLREDIVRRARSKLVIEGRSLSDAVEELLQTYNELDFLDKLCESLGLESRFNTSSEITPNRPTGIKAEGVVREVRDELSNNISRHWRRSQEIRHRRSQ